MVRGRAILHRHVDHPYCPLSLFAVEDAFRRGTITFNYARLSVSQMSTINIPQAFAAFRIEPKSIEANESNMPKSVLEAVTLFHATGKSEEAARCTQCVNTVLQILAEGPDGKSEVAIGYACICWDCGHVGLPGNITNRDDIGQGAEENPDSLFECRQCRTSDQTNLVRGVQADGSSIPWIEKHLK